MARVSLTGVLCSWFFLSAIKFYSSICWERKQIDKKWQFSSGTFLILFKSRLGVAYVLNLLEGIAEVARPHQLHTPWNLSPLGFINGGPWLLVWSSRHFQNSELVQPGVTEIFILVPLEAGSVLSKYRTFRAIPLSNNDVLSYPDATLRVW